MNKLVNNQLHQFAGIGSSSILTFTSITQAYNWLINCFILHVELILIWKKYVIAGAINCWNKTENISGAQSLNFLDPAEIKGFFTKAYIKTYDLFVTLLPFNFKLSHNSCYSGSRTKLPNKNKFLISSLEW